MTDMAHRLRRPAPPGSDPARLRAGPPGAPHPLAARLIALQRTAGNRAVVSTLQRTIAMKVVDFKPLKLINTQIAALLQMLDEYHRVASSTKPPHRDLLALIQQMESETRAMIDGKPGRNATARGLLEKLLGQCVQEWTKVRGELEEARPAPIKLGPVIGKGLSGTAFEVAGRPDLVYKEDTGIRIDQHAGEGIGIKGQSAGRRAVAAARIDKVLGTNVLGDAYLAESSGNEHQGHVMSRAPGRPLKNIPAERRQELFATVGVKQGLYNLQTLDAVTGEADRNTGNIMLHGERVTGIDNETAFSPSMNAEQVADRPMRSDEINYNKGLPPYMSAPVAHRICRLRPEEVTAPVEGLLTRSELAKVTESFERVQVHAGKLIAEGKIIPSVGEGSLPDSGAELSHAERKDYFYPTG